MKALFLGNVAADTANGIRAELIPELQVDIIADPKELSPEIAAATDILGGIDLHGVLGLAERSEVVKLHLRAFHRERLRVPGGRGHVRLSL